MIFSVKISGTRILTHEKEGDEIMTRKRIYLAFLLILGLLVFAGCAGYDGVPDTNPNNGITDNNNGIRDNGITDNNNGTLNNGNGMNGAGNGLNNNTTNNNNNLNQ